jgi:hypothetical protein
LVGTCIEPATRVFGTSFASITRIHFLYGNELKYAAAALISSSCAAFASWIIAFGGPILGSELLRSPFLKSAIC